jgi:hypothetical protein
MDQRNVAMGLASLGRGPDAALVHMSPSEVQALQRLAEQHGGSLTINPSTGLPEAGFLSSLLPTLVGVGLAGLTGGTSLAAMGTLGQVLSNPLATGLISGGLAGLISGDWRQAAKWGLGVGGGQALAGNLATAGTKGITPDVLAGATSADRAAVQSAMNASWAETGKLTGKAAMDQAARIAARNQAGQMAAAKVGLGAPSSYLGGVGERFAAMPRGLGRVLGMKGTTPLLPGPSGLPFGQTSPLGTTTFPSGGPFEHAYAKSLEAAKLPNISATTPLTSPAKQIGLGSSYDPVLHAGRGVPFPDPGVISQGLRPSTTAETLLGTGRGFVPPTVMTPTATGFAAFPGGGTGLGLKAAAALTPALFAENPELEEVDVGGKKIGYPPYAPLDRQVTYTEPFDLADTGERDYFSEPEYRPYDPLIDPWTPLYEPPPTAVGAQGGIVSLKGGGVLDPTHMEQVRGESLGQYAPTIPNPVTPVQRFYGGGEVRYFDDVSGYGTGGISTTSSNPYFNALYPNIPSPFPMTGGLLGHAYAANPNLFGNVNTPASFTRTPITSPSQEQVGPITPVGGGSYSPPPPITPVAPTAPVLGGNTAGPPGFNPEGTPASPSYPVPPAVANTRESTAASSNTLPGDPRYTGYLRIQSMTPAERQNLTPAHRQQVFREAGGLLAAVARGNPGFGTGWLGLGDTSALQGTQGTQGMRHTPQSYQAAVAAGNQATTIGGKTPAQRQAEYAAATGGGGTIAPPPAFGEQPFVPPPTAGARGGIVSLQTGGLTTGVGDGMSDQIMTTIEGRRPAALSAGEFVIPADVVSGIGNGDTNSGAKRLYAMMNNIRDARTGKTAQPQRIAPRLPA